MRYIHENDLLTKELMYYKDLVAELRRRGNGDGKNSLVEVLRHEIGQLNIKIAGYIGKEEKYDESLQEKDAQIRELTDHKIQYSADKFARLQE